MLASKIPMLLFYLTLANMILFSSQHVHYVQPECLTFTRNYRMGHKIGCRKKKGERKKKTNVHRSSTVCVYPFLSSPGCFFFFFSSQQKTCLTFSSFSQSHLTSPHGVDTDTMFCFFMIYFFILKQLVNIFRVVVVVSRHLCFSFSGSSHVLVSFSFGLVCNTSPNTASVQTSLFLSVFSSSFQAPLNYCYCCVSYFEAGRAGCSCFSLLHKRKKKNTFFSYICI